MDFRCSIPSGVVVGAEDVGDAVGKSGECEVGVVSRCVANNAAKDAHTIHVR